MEEAVNAALETLRRGGIILYPTDTVWGIGCDATNAAAIERISRLKGSETGKSMLVLMDSTNTLSRYFDKVPDVAWDLIELTDKPLTLILGNASGVAPALIPATGTLGVRIPNHEFCLKLMRRLGRPLVSTSANPTGVETPRGFDDIDPRIVAGVDYVVPIGCEGRPTRRASSIIQLGEKGEVKVIRE